MGLLNLCSNNSYWNGLFYFENHKVKTLKQINDFEYDADVEGNNLYHVHLDIKHPKKSTCTCPYASGKTIVCKHKVAVYFTIFPDEAKEAIEERNNFYLEQEEREREYDKKEERERNRLKQYVNSLTEEEVRRMLVNYMLSDAMKYEDNPYEDDDWY